MVTKILRFSQKLYSPESVRAAIWEYRRAYGAEIKLKLKNSGGYAETAVSIPEALDKNIFDEFSNFVLFLNIK